MGEIAEMLLDGTLDMNTGEYIGEPCGYPRTLEGYDKARVNGTKWRYSIKGLLELPNDKLGDFAKGNAKVTRELLEKKLSEGVTSINIGSIRRKIQKIKNGTSKL